MPSLQHKIDKLIEAKGLTKSKFAEIIGVSMDTVYNLSESTKLETILKICKFFSLDLSELVYDKKTGSVVNEPQESYVSGQAVNMELLNAYRRITALQDELDKCKKLNLKLREKVAT